MQEQIMSIELEHDNRRRETRLEFNAAYRFYVDGGTYIGTLRNITRNGAFLGDGAAFIPTSSVAGIGDLYITDGDRELVYKAQVIYVQFAKEGPFPAGAGVMFIQSDDQHKALLDKLIADYQRSKAI